MPSECPEWDWMKLIDASPWYHERMAGRRKSRFAIRLFNAGPASDANNSVK